MKFLVDTQLPFKLAKLIRDKGYDCIHTTDRLNGQFLQDEEIIKISLESDRTVVTKDSDFKDNYNSKGAPPKVLYITFGNISNKDLLSYFDDYLVTIVELYESGEDFIEFNREGIFANS